MEVNDVEGDPFSRRVIVETPTADFRYDAIEIKESPDTRAVVVGVPGQTGRRTFKYHRSQLGLVVLAFDRERETPSNEFEYSPESMATDSPPRAE